MSTVTKKQFSQCPQAVHARTWITGFESIGQTTICIYIENSFLRTPKKKMMPLSNIMQFRIIYTSATSHLCEFLDMDQQVVILVFQLLYPLFPLSSILSRHEPSPVRWWKNYKLSPTKFHEFCFKTDSLRSTVHSHLQRLTLLSTFFWTSSEYSGTSI